MGVLIYALRSRSNGAGRSGRRKTVGTCRRESFRGGAPLEARRNGVATHYIDEALARKREGATASLTEALAATGRRGGDLVMADRGGAERSTWRTANGGRGGSGMRQTGSGGCDEASGSV